MTMTALAWTGLALAFLAAFLLSLFDVVLGAFSKISLSRFLEDRDKPDRARILDHCDETALAVEFLRIAVILALGVYTFAAIGARGTRLLWLFPAALAVYAIGLELVPRLLVLAAKRFLMKMFLPAFPLVRVLACRNGAWRSDGLRPGVGWGGVGGIGQSPYATVGGSVCA